MNILYFIKHAPLKSHKAIHQWFRISMLLFAGTLLILAILFLQQSFLQHSIEVTHMALATQVQTFDSIVSQTQEQTKQQKDLQTILSKINTHQMHPKTPLELLKTIQSSFKGTAQLEAFSYQSTQLQIKVSSASSSYLMGIPSLICQNSKYKDFSLQSLEQKEAKIFLATFATPAISIKKK